MHSGWMGPAEQNLLLLRIWIICRRVVVSFLTLESSAVYCSSLGIQYSIPGQSMWDWYRTKCQVFFVYLFSPTEHHFTSWNLTASG
jgi:hypothetical protein